MKLTNNLVAVVLMFLGVLAIWFGIDLWSGPTDFSLNKYSSAGSETLIPLAAVAAGSVLLYLGWQLISK